MGTCKFCFCLFILFFQSQVAASLLCLDVFNLSFESKFSPQGLLQRFDQPLSKNDSTNDPDLEYWTSKIDRRIKIFDLKSFFSHQKAERHSSFHLSRNGSFVIGKSSDNTVRVYDRYSHQLLSSFDLKWTFLSKPIHLTHIVHVSNRFIVAAAESDAQFLHDKNLHLERFFPSALAVFDFNGKLIRNLELEQILKRVEISPDESQAYVMEADNFISLPLSDDLKTTRPSVMSSTVKYFEEKHSVILQTFHLTPDGNYLIVGAISQKGKESKVIVFETQNLFNSMDALAKHDLPFSKIIKITTSSDAIHITGLLPNQVTSTEVQVNFEFAVN